MRVNRSLVLMGWIVMAAGGAGAQSRGRSGRATAPRSGNMARDMLAAHNAVRAGKKLQPLQWSDTLAAASQKWADTLIAQNRFAHNPKSRYGENLFMIRGGAATPAMVVKDWASESRNYNYRSNTCRGTCGHYTQLVARRTLKLGCAVGRGRGREVWVCSYDPPGNIVGQRPY